jgi:hypothetical protein
MPDETNKILSEQDQLRELVSHQGWKIARRIMADKILDLQDAFKIDDRTATAMLTDLRVRKKAAQILFDFLQEIEGTAVVAQDNLEHKSNKAHIVTLE